jgi:hypothetical protein
MPLHALTTTCLSKLQRASTSCSDYHMLIQAAACQFLCALPASCYSMLLHATSCSYYHMLNSRCDYHFLLHATLCHFMLLLLHAFPCCNVPLRHALTITCYSTLQYATCYMLYAAITSSCSPCFMLHVQSLQAAHHPFNPHIRVICHY